ncbi:universal stress protein [Halothiobacillus sp.]|uniref:universal stress protein n=1 Tax=Halothiobacillus sp. TaxID=1891311 RepID=UPI00262908FC|nr:universal stress protein [Halothiobacillus sp.]MDD4965632.1 universal stress protein [Halothiobacillus sp.]
MSIYQRIIVPVDLDGDLLTKTNLCTAIALAQDQKATLKIITVVDEAITGLNGEFGWTDPATLDANMRDDAQRQLDSAARKINDQNINDHNLMAEAEVIEAPDGHIARHIEAAALAWRADLIVIGTRGLHGLARWTYGLSSHTSEDLLRVARLPLLVVPDSAPDSKAKDASDD